MSISENNSQSISTYSDSSQSISTYTDSVGGSSSACDSNCTPFPSMTKSQRVKLNEILHREPIGYASSFDMIEIEPVEPEHVEHAEEQEQKQNQNNSCCIIM